METTIPHVRNTKPALVVRMTVAERALIHRAASLAGQSTNTYCREILLDIAADQLGVRREEIEKA